MQANLFKSMHTCTCVFYIVSNYMYMRVHVGTVHVHVATALTCSWHSIVPCLYSTLIGVFRSKDLVVSCMDGFNVIITFLLMARLDTFTMEASVMLNCMTSMKRLFIHIHVLIYCKLIFIVQFMYMYMYMYGACTFTCSFKTLQAEYKYCTSDFFFSEYNCGMVHLFTCRFITSTCTLYLHVHVDANCFASS